MRSNSFYINNRMTPTLEQLIENIDTLEEFEKRYPTEFLNDDSHIGNYLDELVYKYDKKASRLSIEAGLTHSYVGNILNGKKTNPSRDALICICLELGTTVDEVQYLLKYAGQAPLYVRRKRDVIIWFGFMKGWKSDIVNDKLIKRNYKPIKKDA